MAEPTRRKNLQTFLATMAAHGRKGGFARAGAVRRIESSYSTTLALAGASAEALRRAGVRSGDRVVLCADDGPRWVAAFMGALAAGAVVVPLDASSTGDFFRAAARRCGARALLGDGRGAGRPFDGPRIDLDSLGPGDAALLEPISDPDPADLAQIVFTSGTTALPRGVMITHGNMTAAIAGIEAGIEKRRRALDLVAPVTMIDLVPLSHLFGQALGILIPAILGARVVFSPSRPPRSLLALAKRERAWVVVCVPRHLAALKEAMAQRVRPAAGRLSPRWWVRAIRSLPLVRDHGWRLRAFVVGGARLDPDLERWYKDLGYLVVQGYGLTETAPIISVSNPFDNRVGILGKPSRAQEVRLAEDGEILVRGGNVTPGYFDDPEATRAALEEGWLRTGDLGALEPDGSLRFVGRKKEIIVTGEGQNVFPDEVEEVLRRREGIADCVVVALPGDRGEEVHAVIIPEGVGEGGGVRDTEASRRAVAEAVAEANEILAPHQRVRGWTIWSDLDFPRTPTGKPLRRAVAPSLAGRAQGPAPEGEASGERASLAALRRLAGPDARADQRLGAELGLSSIDIAELAAEIEERYQVEIDPAHIHEDASLGALLAEASARAAPEERWPMPRWARTASARAARSLLQAVLMFPILRIFVRLEDRGRGGLEAIRAPVLIAANHQGHADVPILLAAMPRRLRRRTAVAMQPEYFEPYLKRTGTLIGRLHLGWQYRLTGLFLHTFPFPRSAAFRVGLEYAGDLVDRGWSILVFPEGELSRDGTMAYFRPGVGVLARDLALPVVPGRIEGAFAVLPRGSRFFRTIRGPVSVRWGQPLRIEPGEDPATFASRLEAAVRGL